MEDGHAQEGVEALDIHVQGGAACHEEAEFPAEGLAEFTEDEWVVEALVIEHPQDAAIPFGTGGKDSAGVVYGVLHQFLAAWRHGVDLLLHRGHEHIQDARNHEHQRGLEFGEVALEISDVMGNQAGCPVVEDAGDFTGQRIGMPIGQQRNKAV